MQKRKYKPTNPPNNVMLDSGDVPKGIPNYLWKQVPEKAKQAYRDNPQAARQWYKEMLSSKSGYTPVSETEDKTADYWKPLNTERIGRNLKEVGRMAAHVAKPIVTAGAATAAVQMAGVPLTATTAKGMLGQMGLAGAGAMGLDYMYQQAGGKMPSELLGIENMYGGMLADMFSPGGVAAVSNIGAYYKPRFGKTGQLTDDFVKGNKVLPKQVDNVVPQTPKQWQMQEMPGLHLKSTLPDNPKGIHTNIRQSDGTIDTRTVLEQMKRIEGDAKYAEWEKGFREVYGEGLENLPKRMDYNEFIKTGQKNLIELEHIRGPEINKGFLEKRIDYSGYKTDELFDYEAIALGNKSKFGRGSSEHHLPEETLGHLQVMRTKESPNVLTTLGIQSDAFQGTHRIMPKTFDKESQLRSLADMEDIAKRQKAELSKAVKRSDGYWELPDGTLMDNNVYKEGWTMQGEFNAMKKAEIENFTQKQLLDKNHQERYLQELVDYAGKRGDVNKVRVPTYETAAKVQGYVKVKPVEYQKLLNKYEGYYEGHLDALLNRERDNLRKWQDNIDEIEYGLNPENAKIVSENDYWGGFRTESGVRKYRDDLNFYKTEKEKSIKRIDELPNEYYKEKEIAKKELDDYMSRGGLEEDYIPAHQTILKKYSEQPKTIKKLFGKEPKIVTDSKGNTWYEFDIPKKFKEGKGEIKAFEVLPPAAIIGAGASTQDKPKLKQGGRFKAQETKFTTGGQWEIIEDFKGPSHDKGGIDITIIQ